jgi:hypothetical protein
MGRHQTNALASRSPRARIHHRIDQAISAEVPNVIFRGMERIGLEPMTSAVQVRRSPS